MNLTRQILAPYANKPMTATAWEQLIALLFNLILPFSKRSAELGREFYDSERSRAHPHAPRHDIYLQTLSYDVFKKDMNDLRSKFMTAHSDSKLVERAALKVARNVENSARWTVLKATEEPDPYFDEEDSIEFEESDDFEVVYSTREQRQARRQRYGSRKGVRGWARVATGRETCPWCLMLCSRGAVYTSAKAAGSRLSDTDAVQVSGSGFLSHQEHTFGWHDGCDCKIVPVFDLEDWDGKERADAAYEMWREVTKDLSGKEALAAFRKAAESGEFTKYYN